jgi:hypothetical protein
MLYASETNAQAGYIKAVEPAKSIPTELMSTEQAVEILEASIGALIERLAPVSRSEPQCDGKAGSALARTYTPVGEKVFVIGNRIRALTERVQYASAQLEI